LQTTLTNLHYEKCDVRIDRSGPWGNPFSHLPGDRCILVASRDEACDRHLLFLQSKLLRHPEICKKLFRLRGKRLGCWCSPKRCHGANLIFLIEQAVAASGACDCGLGNWRLLEPNVWICQACTTVCECSTLCKDVK
jgi:hypothetical protein